MTMVVSAVVYALFVWWFATGLVLLLVLRGNRLVCLAGAGVLFLLALHGLAQSSVQTGVSGAYLAFTMAVLLWGTQEIAFLTGAVTGPRPRPRPPGVRGAARLRAALGAILYHELALIASGLAVLAATWQASNQVGALTYLVLWTMRVSAKLNLYLGVPVLHDEVLPSRLAFLSSHFRRAPAHVFFPISVLLSVLALSMLVSAAADPEVGSPAMVGYVLVASLMVLAIVEHAFMLIPLPIARLWAWSSGASASPPRGATDAPSHGDPPGNMSRAVVTSS